MRERKNEENREKTESEVVRKIERKRRRKGGHSWRNPRFREEE